MSSTNDWLSRLNPQQREAVVHTSTPLLVLAGAGSGKTRVIAHKIAWMVDSNFAMAEKITAVTFTNKAATEMRERMTEMLGSRGQGKSGPNISTFHRLGLQILRTHGSHLGLRANFSLIDRSDGIVMVNEFLRKLSTTNDNKLADQVLNQISQWKNHAIIPEHAHNMIKDDEPITKMAAAIYPQYQDYLFACNSVDLDDLILQPLILIKNHDSVRQYWQYSIRYLLVDEYQDTNATQYELIKQLCNGQNLTLVGDDDQSIYAWRGANSENISDLSISFPDVRVIKLEQNYRCTGRILNAANTLIKNNPRVYDKKLWTSSGFGEAIKVLGARDEEHEADRVVASLMHHHFANNNSYGDYAILYRSNHQARVFEKKLREMRIPYYISGGLSFFDRSEIRDIMAYLRLIANPNDDQAFLRIANTPRRGIGTQSLAYIAGLAADAQSSLLDALKDQRVVRELSARQHTILLPFVDLIERYQALADTMTAHALIQQLLEELGYFVWVEETSQTPEKAQQRINNVGELLNWIKNIQNSNDNKDISALISHLMTANMLENKDDFDNQKNQLALMTLHAAKGLEFKHVSIIGLEEGILPHQNSIDEAEFDPTKIEEERRLFYVGITRAEQSLTLSHTHHRNRFGEKIDTEPSRFLEELPQDELAWSTLDQSKKAMDGAEAKSRLAQLKALLEEN